MIKFKNNTLRYNANMETTSAPAVANLQPISCDFLSKYFASPHAIWATIVLTIAIIFMLLFAPQIREKIKQVLSLGKDGAKFEAGNKGQLPNSNIEQIKTETENANTQLIALQSEKEELLNIAQLLNKELEDTKIMLFFERVMGAMVNWQYFMLKIGCENSQRTLTVQQLVEMTKQTYPDLEQYVNADIFIATLDDLQKLNFVEALKPYTLDTPIKFTDLTVAFMLYGNSKQLNL